jgi:hypothetical protein
MMKQTIMVSLATYAVATAVLLGGASALGLIPRDGVDGQDGAAGLNGKDGQNGLDGKDAAIKVYVQKKSDAASQYYATKVSCKSGDTLISGGAVVNDHTNSMYLVESYPSGNSWVAMATPWDERGSTGSITVYAVCQDNP